MLKNTNKPADQELAEDRNGYTPLNWSALLLPGCFEKKLPPSVVRLRQGDDGR